MSGTKIDLTLTLRGQTVSVQATVQGPDRSVGIDGYWCEDIIVFDDETGASLDWELTEPEITRINDAAASSLDSYEPGEY